VWNASSEEPTSTYLKVERGLRSRDERAERIEKERKIKLIERREIYPIQHEKTQIYYCFFVLG